jgi:hypothetical protein
MKGGVVYMRNIEQLEGFSIDTNHIINKKFVFNNKNCIDYEWMKKQIEYIDNLSNRNKHILRAYTIYGDKFINNYLRGTLTPNLIKVLLKDCIKYGENPFLYHHKDKYNTIEINIDYENNILEYIPIFIDELKDIIQKSPRLTKKIKLFRGLSEGNFIVDSLIYDKDNKQFFINNDFLSTTFYLASAVNFMNNDCCLLELNIEPEIPCIFTAAVSRRRNEFEITLIPGSILKLIKCTRKYILNEYEQYLSYEVFLNPKKYNVSIARLCEFNIEENN